MSPSLCELAELEGAGSPFTMTRADYALIQSSFRDATPRHMGSQYVRCGFV